MPCLWLQHNNSQLFINVAIIDAATFNVAGGPIGPQLPGPPPMFAALVDTGAQKTMITTNVVNTLGLQAQGQIPIQGVGPNITWHNGYLFHVAFTMPVVGPAAVAMPPGQMQLMVHVNPNVIYGAELTAPAGAPAAFDVLLGMDILSSGHLSVGANGQFSFSF